MGFRPKKRQLLDFALMLALVTVGMCRTYRALTLQERPTSIAFEKNETPIAQQIIVDPPHTISVVEVSPPTPPSEPTREKSYLSAPQQSLPRMSPLTNSSARSAKIKGVGRTLASTDNQPQSSPVEDSQETSEPQAEVSPPLVAQPQAEASPAIIAQSETPKPEKPKPLETPSAIPTPCLDFKRRSLVSVAPLFSFSKIDVTDLTSGQKSTLGSGIDYGASLGWNQFWSESFQTATFFNIESEHFTTTSTTTQLDSPNVVAGGLNFQGRLGRSDQVQTFGLLGVNETAFVRGETSRSFTLDTDLIANVGAGVSFPLYVSNDVQIRLEAEVDYLSPGSSSSDIPYSVHSGYALGGKLGFLQTNPTTGRALNGELFLHSQNQNTSITNQNSLELGVLLRFEFDFLGNAPLNTLPAHRKEEEENSAHE